MSPSRRSLTVDSTSSAAIAPVSTRPSAARVAWSSGSPAATSVSRVARRAGRRRRSRRRSGRGRAATAPRAAPRSRRAARRCTSRGSRRATAFAPPTRARRAPPAEQVEPDRGASAARENAARHHAPIDIGERGLKIRSMLRNRAGPPEVHDQQDGRGHDRRQRRPCARSAPTRSSPARSHASATNDEPAAIPPTQK